MQSILLNCLETHTISWRQVSTYVRISLIFTTCVQNTLAPINTERTTIDIRADTLVILQVKWSLKPSDILNKCKLKYIDNVSQKFSSINFLFNILITVLMRNDRRTEGKTGSATNRRFTLTQSRLSTRWIVYICEASWCDSSVGLLLHSSWNHGRVMTWRGDFDPLILNLSEPDAVSGQLQALPAIIPRKRPQYLSNRRLGGPQTRSVPFWGQKNLLFLPELKPRFFWRPARSLKSLYRTS